MHERNLACSWTFTFVVLPKSLYKPLEKFSFVEDVISGFAYTKSTKIDIIRIIMNLVYSISITKSTVFAM